MGRFRGFKWPMIILTFLHLSVAPWVSAQNFGIDWGGLKNPIYSHPDWSTKDPALVYREATKTFYVFFSAFFEDRGRVRCHISAVKSKDLKSFSSPLFVRDDVAIGREGLCSPSVVKIDQHYVLTYNSWGDQSSEPNQLFYQTSLDLEQWSVPQALAKELTHGIRAIDAALGKFDGQVVLVWKEKQIPMIARAPSLNGPWQTKERLKIEWFENAQLPVLGDKLFLVGTTKRMQPFLVELTKGHPANWTNAPLVIGDFEIPVEGFNTHDRANAGYLTDFRAYDGYYYLIYAGNTEAGSYAGRGNNQLGLARSRNLEYWVKPE